MTRRVAIVARSAGAANALGPVARALMAQNDIEVSILADPPARSTFLQYGLPRRSLSVDFQRGPAHLLLDAVRPDHLLTGTSWEATLDGELWGTARERGIPSLAVLDHWCNYAERFTGADGARYGCMPDRVAVMDDTAYRAMVGTGSPPDRLIVTGHPGFDELSTCDTVALRAEARFALEIAPQTKLIVFASQPHATADEALGHSPGYTEEDALRLLLDSLDCFNSVHPLVTIVKLHPIEGPERLQVVVGCRKGRDVQILKEFPSRQLIAASDVVVGMTSIFLLEAAVLGRPVVSLQPRRYASDGFVDNFRGLIELAVTPKECPPLLLSALAESEEDWSRRRHLALARGFDGRATQRIVSLVEATLRQADPTRMSHG
jgi:hypothetical protein